MTKNLALVLLLNLSLNCAMSQPKWTQYNGPFAGDVNSIVTFKGAMYATSRLTGVFKSVDGGAHWTKILPQITFAHSLHTTDTSLLIGTDALYSFTDTGEPAIQLGQSLNYAAIQHIHTVADRLFLTTDFGIYQYDAATKALQLKINGIPVDEAGITWTRELASAGDVLYCNVFGKGVFRSDNFGETWTKQNIGGYQWGFLALESANDLLVCGENRNVYLSPDNGVNWQSISYDLPSDAYVWKLKVTNNAVICSTLQGTYKLPLGTTSWAYISHRTFEAFNENGDVLFASDFGGLYQWNEESAAFKVSNHGINTSKVNQIVLFNGRIYSATERGLYFTRTDEDNWFSVAELADQYVRAVAKKDTILFAGSWKGLYMTTKNSQYWVRCENGITADVPVWDIEVSGDNVYVATDEGVYVSRNSGKAWTLLTNSISPIGQMTTLSATSTKVLSGNTTGLYVLLEDSTDWKHVAFSANQEVFSLNTIDDDIYVLFMNSPMYKSTDNGITWKVLQFPLTARVDMIKRGNNIYAATFSRIYYSNDNGESWSYWSETGVPDVLLTTITEGDSAFYVGTYGKSIFRRPFLSSADLSSDVYAIADGNIYNVPENCTLEEFISNVEASYGASIVLTDNESGRGEESATLSPGDQIVVVAEDGKTKTTLRISDEKLVTGIETGGKEILSAYPVPTSGILHIDTREKLKSIEIVDSQGMKANRFRWNSSAEQIDVSALPPGLYILKAETITGKRKVTRFLRQ